jgi:hypothetical protein
MDGSQRRGGQDRGSIEDHLHLQPDGARRWRSVDIFYFFYFFYLSLWTSLKMQIRYIQLSLGNPV